MQHEKDFSTQEILDGLALANQALTQHGLPLMNLDQYKETLRYPISEEAMPQLSPKS
jgi:hypothetical protein